MPPPRSHRRGGRAREFAEAPLPQVRLEIPAGLTPSGEAVLRAAIDRVATAKAANTLRGYAGDWSVWCHAARHLGLRPLRLAAAAGRAHRTRRLRGLAPR